MFLVIHVHCFPFRLHLLNNLHYDKTKLHSVQILVCFKPNLFRFLQYKRRINKNDSPFHVKSYKKKSHLTFLSDGTSACISHTDNSSGLPPSR